MKSVTAKKGRRTADTTATPPHRGASGSDKSDAILDAAAQVFMQSGFAAASVDDISEAYGATKGIIYYHFKNKSALFFAVQRRAMEMTRDAIEPHALSDKPAGQRLRDMAKAHTLLMMRHLSYLRVAAQGLELHLSSRTTAEERAELKAITDLRDGNEALYTKVIQEGVESSAFRKVDAKLLVKPLLGALNWTSRWYRPRSGETAADREHIAEEIATFALQALAASAGAATAAPSTATKGTTAEGAAATQVTAAAPQPKPRRVRARSTERA